MGVFVDITPDPFAEQFRNETSIEKGLLGRSEFKRVYPHVRRPVRGIQLKESTYATIQVRKANGQIIPLIDGGGLVDDENNPGIGISEKYSNFLLQSIQEERAEKTQVVQTFGEPFIFFFGEHPRVIQGNGVLLNTEDFNWRAEFWENYDRYLRGSKCVQNKTRITMSWDDIVIEGYFLQASATESATEPNYVNFQFQIFLTNYQNVSAIGASDFPSGSFEGNVDPDQIDIPGLGVLPASSDTALVRQLNIKNPTSSVKNSLFQALRDGISQVAQFDGQLQALFNLTDNLIDHSKRVRVPRGFAGGSVFDVDTQIALASVDPTAQQVIIRSTLSGKDFFITGRKGIRALPATFGKFRDALDEYIGSASPSSNDPAKPINLFADQTADYRDIEQKIRDVFEVYGVDIDPPLESVLLATKLTFGAVQVRVGTITKAVGIPPLRDVLKNPLI